MITRKFDRLTGSLHHDCQDWRGRVKDHCQSLFHGLGGSAEGIAADATESEVQEYYQTLLRGLAWPGDGSTDALKTLAITSCHRAEGVSTVAARLAVTAAASGTQRVLLVDANLSRPSLHKAFGLKLKSGQSDPSRPRPSIQPTCYKNLHLLTAAGLGNGSTSIYSSAERFSQLVAAAKRSFDLVVFDMPPAHPANLSLALFSLFDGVVLVAEAERVRREVAERTRQKLAQAGAKLRGVVLNKRTYHVPNWLYRTL